MKKWVPVLSGALLLLVVLALTWGRAAGLGVSSAKVSVFRPTDLPPAGCSSPGSQTLTSTRDSWLDQNSPSNNFGTDAILKLRSQSGTNNKRVVVGFTLPSIPAGCTVSLATLRLYNASAVSGRTINAYRLGASWTESGITWNNQPAADGSPVGTASSSGWMAWTVTTQVQSMYSSGNHGFSVRDSAEGGAGIEQQFESREKDNKPQLIVQWN